MITAKEILRLSSSDKKFSKAIIDCYNMILRSAKACEHCCIIKSMSFDQNAPISHYFISKGFNVSIVRGMSLFNPDNDESYILISWDDDKKINEIDHTESNTGSN
jgi:hypothetical protein